MDPVDEKRKKLFDSLIDMGILKTKTIIKAFKDVPRHLFVPNDQLDYAYSDIVLPTIGNSTISQPATVATMLELLQPKEGDKILEIGTGSGWEACLLSKCVGEKGSIITIEISPEVEGFAKSNMYRSKRKIDNIKMVIGDGSVGYPEGAPYNKIICTAAMPRIPQELIDQLKVGGRIVAPVGTVDLQIMKVVDKISQTETKVQDAGTFQFVPLKGRLGFG
jgi:protein-L-isoaspartate(D-aspartate) O-methyltransferase